MSEWNVVTALSILIGLFFTVGKPILSASAKIATSLAALEASINTLDDRLGKFEDANTAAHKRIWDRNDEQDDVLRDHSLRLHDLDGK